jgi:hypothetical protein
MAQMFAATASRLDSRFERFKFLASIRETPIRRYRTRRGNARIARANALRSPKHAQLGGGRSQPLARRFPRAGRTESSWDLEPLKGRMLFLGAEPLDARNGVVLIDVKAAMSHAFTPALPRINQRVYGRKGPSGRAAVRGIETKNQTGGWRSFP